MLFIGFEKIEFGIFLQFHAQIVEAFNWRVAGQEILRSGTERDDLQILEGNKRVGDRLKFADHFSAIFGIAYGIFRNVSFEIPESEIVAGVQHAAIGVAPVVQEFLFAFLRRANQHGRSLKIFHKERFGCLRAEVAKENHERLRLVFLEIIERRFGVQLVFNNDWTFVDLAVFLFVRFYYLCSSAFRKTFGKAVPGDGHDA